MSNNPTGNKVEDNSLDTLNTLKKYKKHIRRQEKYLFVERDKGKTVRFDEAYHYDAYADSVEEIIRKQHIHKALIYSLRELTELEQQIIDECFFCDKKSYTELSKLHNISRQAYTKKLNRILNKLRVLIDFYYEDF